MVEKAASEVVRASPVPGYSSAILDDRILVCVRTRPMLARVSHSLVVSELLSRELPPIQEEEGKDFKVLSFAGDRKVVLHDVKKNVDLSLRLVRRL